MSKEKKGKWNPLLIYTVFLKLVSAVREFGVKKYGAPEDWRTTNRHEHVAAALRHIYEYQDGIKQDKESGLHPLAHASTNLMFILEAEDANNRGSE